MLVVRLRFVQTFNGCINNRATDADGLLTDAPPSPASCGKYVNNLALNQRTKVVFVEIATTAYSNAVVTLCDLDGSDL
jgi:hypothetical protein